MTKELWLSSLFILLISCSLGPVKSNYQRLPSSISGNEYNCHDLMLSIISRNRPVKMSVMKLTKDPSLYFSKMYKVKKPSFLAAITIKTKLWESYARQSRIKVGNELSFNLEADDFVFKLDQGKQYTYALTKDEFVFSETGRGIDNLLSKHSMMTKKKDVYFAGEMFVLNGKLHIDNGSGTYRPEAKYLPNIKKYFSDNFGIDVVIKVNGEEEELVTKVMQKAIESEDLKLVPFEKKTSFSIYKVQNVQGEVVGIFKPEESGIINFLSMFDIISLKRTIEPGGKIKRDLAYYGISEKLGLGIVPPTKRIEYNTETGPQLDFLDGYITAEDASSSWLKKTAKKQVQSMYLLDIVLGHQDRHSKNFMINAVGDLKVIDNDLALHNLEKLRWRASTDLNTYFPSAIGEVDSNLKEVFLNLTPVELQHLLVKYNLEKTAIDFALIRLEYIKQSILKNKTMSEINDGFSPLASVSCNAGIGECMKRIRRAVLLGSGLAISGVIFDKYIEE